MSGRDKIVASIWERAGGRRRLLLLFLMIVPSLMAANVMYTLLPPRGGVILNSIGTALFALLFSWISVGFWSATAGLMVSLRRYDRFALTLGCPDELVLPDGVRTAVLFPVYNEDAHEVTEGIRTVWQSLRSIGMEGSFDFFILSDSTNPEAWVQEEEAWYNLCREENAFGRIFYRHRKSNLKRKSGNVADFCRRWGRN